MDMPGLAILTLPILLFSVVFHECAHGWMADRNGDPTARHLGRLTLNPIPHLDLWGSILLPGMLLFAGSPILFGYAKPVPVNTSNLRHPRWDGLKVALVGPTSNLVLAVGFAFLFEVLARQLGRSSPLTQLAFVGVLMNCLLAVFNLIPVPPLDGSWVLDHTLPPGPLEAYERLKPFGILVLLGILFIPALNYYLIRLPRDLVASIILTLSGLPWGGSAA